MKNKKQSKTAIDIFLSLGELIKTYEEKLIKK